MRARPRADPPRRARLSTAGSPATTVCVGSRFAVLLAVAGVVGLAVVLGLTVLGTNAGAAKPTSTPAAPIPVRPAAAPVKARVAPGPVCTPGTSVRLESSRLAYAVTVRRRAIAYRRPGSGKIAVFGRRNINGVPTVFGVLGA